ncbi:hypothetical protein D1AOALGA4SA_8742 [Olavius algarvensis Delta 1 endosymbiont]|nr:hypothetical protein D1AOALGA4SA_8742 [Olavius algarvensis Delta 1 endosymbiont]
MNYFGFYAIVGSRCKRDVRQKPVGTVADPTNRSRNNNENGLAIVANISYIFPTK